MLLFSCVATVSCSGMITALKLAQKGFLSVVVGHSDFLLYSLWIPTGYRSD